MSEKKFHICYDVSLPHALPTLPHTELVLGYMAPFQSVCSKEIVLQLNITDRICLQNRIPLLLYIHPIMHI